MVEGHSVHRIASRFRNALVGKRFIALSPNKRFEEGAKLISGKYFTNIEAVGKNLFAFFSPTNTTMIGNDQSNNQDKCAKDNDIVVIHVHFGMSGVWSLHDLKDEPELKPTCRLRLEEILPTTCDSKMDVDDAKGEALSVSLAAKIVAHLSCMTLVHGGPELYITKRAALGMDPLRPDANPEALYDKILLLRKKKTSTTSKGTAQKKSVRNGKSIGQLIMDQSYFAGPGNIYRAEILFLAGVHPSTPAYAIDRDSFDRIWDWSVKLLQRGYNTGSILTVDHELDPKLANKKSIRRYIYNRSTCARCNGRVISWDMSGRTCYACEQCQKLLESAGKPDGVLGDAGLKDIVVASCVSLNDSMKVAVEGKTKKQQHAPFLSHCAPESAEIRLKRHGPSALTVKEIRSLLQSLVGIGHSAEILPPKSAKKAAYTKALADVLSSSSFTLADKSRKEDASDSIGDDDKERSNIRKTNQEEGQKLQKSTSSSYDVAVPSFPTSSNYLPAPTVSAEDAAREKKAAGEHRGVEHVAELSSQQAIRAIGKNGNGKAATVTPSTIDVTSVVTPDNKTKRTKKANNGTKMKSVPRLSSSIAEELNTPSVRRNRRNLVTPIKREGNEEDRISISKRRKR